MSVGPRRGRGMQTCLPAYPDLALDANGQLLVQPDLNGRMLLEEFEDEVDGR